MTTKWNELSTSEIVNALKEMQYEHENIKKILLKLWEAMEELEQDYENGNIELKKRIILNIKKKDIIRKLKIIEKNKKRLVYKEEMNS
jgi:predicted  nucleic acid-binding Zn-ribbon protein